MGLIKPPTDLKNRQTGQGDIYRIYIGYIYIIYIAPGPIYMHIFCQEPFVLSPAPHASLILMLTRGARLGGATAQPRLEVLRYRPLGPFNIFFENDKITLEKF